MKKQAKTCNERHVSSEKSAGKEGIAEKMEKLEEKLNIEQEKSKEYLNRLAYLQADFENYRKRVERELLETVQRNKEDLIICLIDVLDDLENALLAGKATESKDALLEGVEMVQKNLNKILEKEGLMRLETVGKPFDPNKHEILGEMPVKNHQHGIIVEEARKGYMFKGKVVRPSIVKIAYENLGDKEK